MDGNGRGLRYDISNRSNVPLIRLSTPLATYPILIGTGLVDELSSRLRQIRSGRNPRIFVVTSPEIWTLWSDRFLASFPTETLPTVLHVPSGERHKRLRTVEVLAEQMALAGADRDSLLLAFGGGVVGDVTGFLAAVYMRGIPFVQIPTTLLAQVDSSIGGKTGVNLRSGKNLIGSFHHPLAVLTDVDLLATLPARELRSGLQESVKAGVIADPRLFADLERHLDKITAPESLDREVLTRIVAASVHVKADVVAADEREAGLRMTLNFGHTLGHAIEAATGYKHLLHGEAVGWGMIAAVQLALARGSLRRADAARIEQIIFRLGPLPRFRASAEQLVALTGRDKKKRSGSLAFVLPKKIGEVEIVRDVSQAELMEAAHSMLALMRQQTVGQVG